MRADAKQVQVKPALEGDWAQLEPQAVLRHQAFYSDVLRHAPELELTVGALRAVPQACALGPTPLYFATPNLKPLIKIPVPYALRPICCALCAVP